MSIDTVLFALCFSAQGSGGLGDSAEDALNNRGDVKLERALSVKRVVVTSADKGLVGSRGYGGNRGVLVFGSLDPRWVSLGDAENDAAFEGGAERVRREGAGMGVSLWVDMSHMCGAPYRCEYGLCEGAL